MLLWLKIAKRSNLSKNKLKPFFLMRGSPVELLPQLLRLDCGLQVKREDGPVCTFDLELRDVARQGVSCNRDRGRHSESDLVNLQGNVRRRLREQGS